MTTHIRFKKMLVTASLAATLSTFAVFDANPVLAYSVTTTSTDPGKTLRHSYSLSPGIEVGSVTSCLIREATTNRKDYCRVIDGYEGVGTSGNWKIDFAINESPLSVTGSNSSSYGYAIVLANGASYEGCTWYSPSNDYICDYRARKPKVLSINSSTANYVLRKAWNWTQYTGNALACAGGIAGIWSGNKVTAPVLTACVDGPM